MTTGSPVEPAVVVPHRGLFLALVCSVQFILLIGGTVVTVSLPAIRQELHLGEAQLQWVLTAFSLTFGCLLLLGGRAADLYGRKRLFLAGVALFTVGSLLCAAASQPAPLIAARALAGVGAAMASPAAMSLLTAVFVTPRDRGVALGVWAAVGAIGATLGNVVGGLLTSAGGWRWIFIVNVPVCVIAFCAAFVLVPALPRLRGKRLGLVSGILATVGVAGLLAGLAEVQVNGIGPVAVAMLVASVLAGVAFVVVQAHSADPLLPLGLFRQRTAIAFVLVLMLAGCGIGSYFISSLYMQEILGWNALVAGVAFVPWAALTAVVAQIVSRNLYRVGPRVVVPAAMLCAGVGAVLLAVGLHEKGTFGSLLPAFLLLGAGSGAAGVSCTVTAMSGIPRARHGVGAGALNSTQAVGSTVAIAVVALLASVAGAREGAVTADVLTGYRFALFIVAGLAILGSVVALALPRHASGPEPADGRWDSRTGEPEEKELTTS